MGSLDSATMWHRWMDRLIENLRYTKLLGAGLLGQALTVSCISLSALGNSIGGRCGLMPVIFPGRRWCWQAVQASHRVRPTARLLVQAIQVLRRPLTLEQFYRWTVRRVRCPLGACIRPIVAAGPFADCLAERSRPGADQTGALAMRVGRALSTAAIGAGSQVGWDRWCNASGQRRTAPGLVLVGWLAVTVLPSGNASYVTPMFGPGC